MKKSYSNLLLAAAFLSFTGSASALTPEAPLLEAEFLTINDGVLRLTVTAPTKTQADFYNGIESEDITAPLDSIVITRTCYDLNIEAMPVVTLRDVEPGAVLTYDIDPIEIGYSWYLNSRAFIGEEGSDIWYGSAGCYSGIQTQNPSMTVTSAGPTGPVTLDITLPAGVSDPSFSNIPFAISNVEITRKFRTLDSWVYSDPIVLFSSDEERAAGSSLTFVDDNNGEPMPEGRYEYVVTAGWKWGLGKTSYTAQLYMDAPAAPENIKAVKTDDGVMLTWDAPTTGNNYGFIEPDKLTYDVYRVDGYNLNLIASDLTDLFYVDSIEDITEPTSIQWHVRAKNEQGESSEYGGRSEALVVGPNLTLPFHETFDKAGMYSLEFQYPWTLDDMGSGVYWQAANSAAYYPDQVTWQPVEVKPEAPATGMARLAYDSYYSTGMSQMTSPTIDVTDMEAGMLEFDYYVHPNSYCFLIVQLVRFDLDEGGQDDPGIEPLSIWDEEEGPEPYENVFVEPLYDTTATDGEWRHASINITSFADDSEMRVRFIGESDFMPECGYIVPICVTNVNVTCTQTVGVESVAAAAETVSTEYFNLQGVRLSEPAQGDVVIRRSVLSNGQVKADKVIIK